jgi:adenine-specific DNA-methyltransferase
MKLIPNKGPLFSQVTRISPSEKVAKGDISPYESFNDWGNNNDPEALKELGQVATPSEIAYMMASWVAIDKPHTILDPAAGLGNLLFESHTLCPSARLFGVEHDVSTYKKALHSAPSGTQLVLGDYLKLNFEKMDAIIANPPYVKAHHLIYNEVDWASFDAAFKIDLNRLTNLYALFLLKIWEDLADNGRAAVIIPAEFLNANFGISIKKRLINDLRPVGIAVFDPSFSVFKNALTTSCILFIKKGREKHLPVITKKVHNIQETKDFVQYLTANSFQAKFEHEYLDISSWAPEDKWLNRILGVQTLGLAKLPMKIGDYFRCRRGIATGANDYFTLSRSDINSKQLKLTDFSPCITHSIHANGLIFSKNDFIKLEQSEKRCYLLNPKGIDTNLRRYLDEGMKAGIPERHLPSHRPVWYLPENREPADIWIGVFSRESLKCVMSDAKIMNLTCFHGLYANKQQIGLSELATLFLNSKFGKTAFSQVNRFYGNGLNKLEPKDVEAMPCPVLSELTESATNKLRKHMTALGQDNQIGKQEQIDALASEILHLKD